MRVHFIAIGGSAMHNLAIALHQKGYIVSGSDDEIFEPSRTRLGNLGLLPETEGWDTNRITAELDAVIVGMHAKKDNPELEAAHRLGLKIYSYPEFLYEASKDKFRVVIGGSHGKTTITSMVMHVAKNAGIDIDYMVGAKIEGFDVMVKLTDEAPFMIFEGDEYLTSPIDPRPKFHLYHPHIALLSGIAWDHMNVFPTFDDYVIQFNTFYHLIETGGTFIYFEEDKELRRIAANQRSGIQHVPYSVPNYQTKNGRTTALLDGIDIPLTIFGKHNLANLNGAWEVCKRLGIGINEFASAMRTFKGAANRLECVFNADDLVVYRDFAHSPSKVKATVTAVREQYPNRKVVAIFELHTFSSLSKAFLPEYMGALNAADQAVVFYSPHALELKRLPALEVEDIFKGFGKDNLKVISNRGDLVEWLQEQDWANSALLLMSSGSFEGISPAQFVGIITQDKN